MIGEEVRRQREELGLTGAQLAARASLAPSAVSQIETGRRNPSSMSVMKLADALGVEVGELDPNKAQAPLPLEESERGVTPGIPFSAERALTLADSDSFRREAKAASVEELQQVALELARFVEVPIREEWVEERQADRKAWRGRGSTRREADAKGVQCPRLFSVPNTRRTEDLIFVGPVEERTHKREAHKGALSGQR